MSGHIFQSRSNTCVLACLRMVLKSRGRPRTEEDLVRDLGEPPPRGYRVTTLSHVLGEPSYVFLDLAEPTNMEKLESYLRQGQVIAAMYSGPMTVFAREYIPLQRSPYGELVTLYEDRESLMSYGKEQHVVVLSKWERDGVLLLDPYHTSAHQPLHMSDEWLIKASTGQLWVP